MSNESAGRGEDVADDGIREWADEFPRANTMIDQVCEEFGYERERVEEVISDVCLQVQQIWNDFAVAGVGSGRDGWMQLLELFEGFWEAEDIGGIIEHPSYGDGYDAKIAAAQRWAAENPPKT